LIDQPVISEITKESFKMSWGPPSYLGGCPITEYTLFRDDGHVVDTNTEASDVSI